MGALDNVPLSAPDTRLFPLLQRFLVSRDFLAFALNIGPALEQRELHNRDVYLLLLKDAFDMLGHDSTPVEQSAIDCLYDRHFADFTAITTSDETLSVRTVGKEHPSEATPNVIQLRRVVQVTNYQRAGFDCSDRYGFQRTVYRSPQERTFHRAAQLRYPGLFALPNYPLASALNADWLKRAVDRRTFAFAMRSVLDVLLVTPSEGDPIVAFELDSNFHDEAEAQKRDKMKDAVLQLAKIPLYRLRVEDPGTATVDDWYAVLEDQVGEMPVPKRHRSREQSLFFVPA